MRNYVQSILKSIAVTVFILAGVSLSTTAFAGKGGVKGGPNNDGGGDGGGGKPSGPTLQNDTLTIQASSASGAINVLANDQGSKLSVLLLQGQSVGQWIHLSSGAQAYIYANGDFTYRPNGAFDSLPKGQSQTDTLDYTAQDRKGNQASAQVIVSIQGVYEAANRAPIASSDNFITNMNTNLNASSLLNNDSDPEGDSISILSPPSTTSSGGALSFNSDGSFSYRPPSDYTGTDSFTYQIQDEKGAISNLATVQIQVNDPSVETPVYVQAIMAGDNYRANYPEPMGTPVTMKYMFVSEVPWYYPSSSYVWDSFHAFDEQEKQLTREMLAEISSFCGITFVEVFDVSQTDIIYAFSDLGGSALGSGFYPGSSSQASDVWIDIRADGNMVRGSSHFATLIHETGHALGLSHPDYTKLSWIEETRKYTVMGYGQHPSIENDAETPQMYDIAALQHLYGPASQPNQTNTIYDLSLLTNSSLTIYDDAGVDTLDASSAQATVMINLNSGAFSSVVNNCSGCYENIGIAISTVLENVIGSAFDDRLISNLADNQMTGGLGSDTFVFEANWGNDVIKDFQSGIDKLDLTQMGLNYNDVSIQNTTSGTLIQYQGQSILLENINSITSADFL